MARSYRLALTKDVAKVADEVGNSPAMIYSRYRKALPKELGEKWANIMPRDQGKIVSLPNPEKEQPQVAEA